LIAEVSIGLVDVVLVLVAIAAVLFILGIRR
jgi:hypothetical protein